jgi:HSP20 family protein
MNLTRTRVPDISPWRELEELPQRLARAFGTPIFTELPIDGMAFMPAVDITENDRELMIKVELAGMKREDIDVQLDNGILAIKGEKKEEKEERTPQRHLWERRYGRFERSFTLPRDVDADRVNAEFSDGLLVVRVPKQEQTKGKKIEIGGKTAK